MFNVQYFLCTIGLNIAKPLQCKSIHQGLSNWTKSMVGGRGEGVDCGLGDFKMTNKQNKEPSFLNR